jgi:Domain of unknown function (DUF4411)
MLYLLDANILMTAHLNYYPIDSVPEWWEWIAHQAEAEALKMPLEIYEEIKDGGTDQERDLLFAWAVKDNIKNAPILKEEVNQALVARCTSVGYAPDLTDDELLQVGRDPFLIAYAMASLQDRCVVTNEASAPSKQRQNKRIPDVCSTLGVQCCNTFAMMKALGFKTGWKTAS